VKAEALARIDQARNELRDSIEQAGNTLAAYIGELEDRLEGRPAPGGVPVGRLTGQASDPWERPAPRARAVRGTDLRNRFGGLPRAVLAPPESQALAEALPLCSESPKKFTRHLQPRPSLPARTTEGAPELGAAAQARLRHRPRTMPVLWRAEDHRRHHRCAGDRAHPDPSGPLRARPTTLAGTGAGPASRGLTSAQPIPFERTDAPPRCRLCLGLASAARSTLGPALAGRLTRAPDSGRPQTGRSSPRQARRRAAGPVAAPLCGFQAGQKRGFEFPSAAAGRNQIPHPTSLPNAKNSRRKNLSLPRGA
jgi:hypothetical protein